MTAEEIAGRFDAARRGREWLARCPCHEDSTPSLGITDGRDGNVVVRCRAGCDTGQVLATVGLTLKDLFATNGSTAHAREIVATYDYRDERRRLLYQVVRFSPKQFRQRRPSGDEWEWSLGDVRRVLYRLPELAAADPEEPVYIVEGEKDVDRLVELGFLATTNAGGAGQWRAEYTAALTDRDIVLLPDNDEPGRKHAEEVARALAPTAVRVRVVELPGLPIKGDVSDWLEHHDAGELRRVVAGQQSTPAPLQLAQGTANGKRIKWRRAPEFVDEILARANEPWVSLSLGMGREIARIRPGGIVVVMGPSGSGKTSLVAGLMIAHARHWGPAVYLSCELPGDEITARMIGMQCDASWEDVLRGRIARSEMERALDLPRLIIVERQDATLDTLDEAIAAARAAHPGEPVLAAVDYTQIVPSPSKELRPRMNDIMAGIDVVARHRRAVVLGINQMSRANARAARAGDSLGVETADLAAESAAIERFATMTLSIGSIKRINDAGDESQQLSIGKGRMGGGDQVLPLLYEGRSGRHRVDGDPRPASEVRAELLAKQDGERIQAASMAMLGAAGKAKDPISRSELLSAAAVKHEIGRIALSQLLSTGELVEIRIRRQRAQYWLIWTPQLAAERQLPLVKETP
jgi:5S rRNA maturation endonuclease (ribonuclease M5)